MDDKKRDVMNIVNELAGARYSDCPDCRMSRTTYQRYCERCGRRNETFSMADFIRFFEEPFEIVAARECADNHRLRKEEAADFPDVHFCMFCRARLPIVSLQKIDSLQ